MRKITIIGLVVMLAVSAVNTGTIFAQDDATTQDQEAWLGIHLSDTDDGVVIRRVSPNSPAENGGLLAGDVIISVDGEAIESAEAVVEAVQTHVPGDVIEVAVIRDASEETVEIELGTASTNGRERKKELFAAGDLDPLVMAEMVLHVELDAVDDGYEVLAGRMRSQSDLEVGDVITAVNDIPVQDVDWAALVTDLVGSDSPTLTITVQRDGEEVTVESSLFGGFRDHRGGFGGRDSERQPGDNSHRDNEQPNDDQQSGSVSGPAFNSISLPA